MGPLRKPANTVFTHHSVSISGDSIITRDQAKRRATPRLSLHDQVEGNLVKPVCSKKQAFRVSLSYFSGQP